MHVVFPARTATNRPKAVHDLEAAPETPYAALELTTRCNLRCVYCLKAQPRERFDPADPHDAPHMVLGVDLGGEALATALAGLEARRTREVTINGHGETTLFSGWEKVASTLIDRGIRVIITSNFARKFKPDEVEVLARFGRIYISLDSSDAGLLARYRPRLNLATVLDNHARIRGAARRLGISGPEFCFCAGLYAEVIPTVEDLARLAVSLNLTHIIFWNQYLYPEIEGADNVTPLCSLSLDDKREVVTKVQSAVDILDEAGITVEFDAEWFDALKAEVAGDPPPPDEAINVWRPSLTRRCIEPWAFAHFQANGTVAPCRVRVTRAIPLDDDHPAVDILDGAEFRQVRHALLIGNLDEACARCHHKPVVTTEELRRHVIDFLLLKNRERNETGFLAPAEMDAASRMVEFAHVAQARDRGLADRVYLVPNNPGEPASTLWLKKVDLTGFAGLLVECSVDNDRSGRVLFRVACNDVTSGEAGVQETVSVGGGETAARLIDISGLTGKHDVVITTQMDVGVKNNAFAWAWVAYPVLLTADEMDAMRELAETPTPADKMEGCACRG